MQHYYTLCTRQRQVDTHYHHESMYKIYSKCYIWSILFCFFVNCLGSVHLPPCRSHQIEHKYKNKESGKMFTSIEKSKKNVPCWKDKDFFGNSDPYVVISRPYIGERLCNGLTSGTKQVTLDMKHILIISWILSD